MKAEAAPVFVAILFPDDKWLITFNTVNNRDVFDNPSDKWVANNNINIEIVDIYTDTFSTPTRIYKFCLYIKLKKTKIFPVYF